MSDYLSTKDFSNIDTIFKAISSKSEKYWSDGISEKALEVFRLAVKNVVGYRKFLQKHNITPSNISTLQEFKSLPILTKNNYLKSYPFSDILIGEPEDIKSFYMSSGTTGEPGIWPRLPVANEAYSIFVNFIYEAYWSISTKKTLYISALDLGIWASGNLQFHAATYCASRNQFTFANTGANYQYVYHTIKNLHKYYDLILIAAYPSFVRRLLDYLKGTDLDIRKLNLRFMLGGEPHTVEWRRYVLDVLGRDKNDLTTVLDYYGTSDSGGPGMSTPFTTYIQNLCYEDESLCQDLFDQKAVPSFFQQNPTLYVEEVNRHITITYPGMLPLCRYDSGDLGGLIRYGDVIEKLRRHGYLLKKISQTDKVPYTDWKWAFIYLTGRSDDAVSIGGALVYPSDIEGLFFQESTECVNSFKIAIREDTNHNQKFVIYIEMKKNFPSSAIKKNNMLKKLKTKITHRLRDVNIDYAAAYEMDPEICEPIIEICTFQTEVFSGDKEKQKANFIVK